jgi:hypothetical protein
MSCLTFIKLSRGALARRDVVRRVVQRSPLVSRRDVGMTTHAFELTQAELWFARVLLSVQSQLWLYRTHQRTFAGDFVVIDVSSPEPSRRPVFAVELKHGERVRVHDGTPLQLRNAGLVITDIASTGIIARDQTPAMLTGGAAEVVSYLRAGRC